MPTQLNLTESMVEAALLIQFILWFAEILAAIVVGIPFVTNYWWPIAYVFPVPIGVVIAMILFVIAGASCR